MRIERVDLGAVTVLRLSGDLDERGVDYGVWCNYHGHVIEEKSEK